ncbi:MAG: hypothetical protein CL885_00515 [Dehalococcoidia bacterium]|nr:hypothetical protein [Dehalococcoidia bacterium]
MQIDRSVQFSGNPITGDRCINRYRMALLGKVIDHVEQSQPAPTGKLVTHKFHAPIAPQGMFTFPRGGFGAGGMAAPVASVRWPNAGASNVCAPIDLPRHKSDVSFCD